MRCANWEEVLLQAVGEAQDRGFQWSRCDCVTWAFEVRARLIGDDPTPLWRGKYSCLTGGLRVLRRLGHASISDLVTAQCGAPVPVLTARRGDLVQLQATALGVCLGAMVATMEDGVGYTTCPLTDALAAWRVE